MIVMPKANGTLEDLRDKYNIQKKHIIKIILALGDILKCIVNNKINYFDIKPENILYQCNSNYIKIWLGDVGSFLLGPPEIPIYNMWLSVHLFYNEYNINLIEPSDHNIFPKFYTFYLILLYFSLNKDYKEEIKSIIKITNQHEYIKNFIKLIIKSMTDPNISIIIKTIFQRYLDEGKRLKFNYKQIFKNSFLDFEDFLTELKKEL